MTFKVGQIVKSKANPRDLYEVVEVITSSMGLLLVCYRLSGYDGMPIGGKVHLSPADVEGG